MIVFSDMSQVVPQSAVSREITKYTWRTVDYETEHFSGVLLAATAESEVPEVTLHLHLDGWHHVYVGLWNAESADQAGVSVRLSRDGATSYVEGSADKACSQKMVECYWKSDDLTGQSIIFAHPKWGVPVVSYVIFVRCAAMSEEEVAQIKRDRERSDTRRLIGMNDMHGLLYIKRPTSIEVFYEDLEPYRNTDFYRVDLEYWGYGDAEDYTDHKGMLLGNGILFESKGARNYSESRKMLTSKGINFYSGMIEYARNMGLKVYLSQRMNAFVSEIPFDMEFTSSFFTDFPQWRCRDKDGSEIARMSLAFAEVQDNLLSTFRRMASYGPDGINLLFNRGMPFLLYEEPLLVAFRSTYGVDPRTLDEWDEHWLSFRADVMTGFMRRVKDAMAQSARAIGRDKIHISVVALANGAENRKFGLDIAAWAKEGLIDEVIAYAIAIPEPGVKTPSSGHVVGIDVEYYKKSVENTECKLFVDMLPRDMKSEEYIEKASDYYAKGADGLCFWDTTSRYIKLQHWSAIAGLGHVKELRDAKGADNWRPIQVKSLHGLRVDRYPPEWGL